MFLPYKLSQFDDASPRWHFIVICALMALHNQPMMTCKTNMQLIIVHGVEMLN